MNRRTALAMLGGSAIGTLGLSATADTAVAAERPSFEGLTRDTTFEPKSLGGRVEAKRIDTSNAYGAVEVLSAIRYPDTADTTIEFAGFDGTPSDVDVALFDVTRGTVTDTSFQLVNFEATFQYDSGDAIDDFFVDMVGDTLID